MQDSSRKFAIKEKGIELENLIRKHCPPSRESAIAITNLQQAILWVIEAIDIHGVSNAQNISESSE